MPHDIDAERAVLGACFVDDAALDTVEPILAAASFYHPANATMFAAIMAVRARGEPVDIITVAGELRQSGKLNVLGGPVFLSELTDGSASTAHVEAHARRVTDLATVRATIRAAFEIAADGETATDFAAYRNAASAKILAATDVTVGDDPVPLEVAIGEAFAKIEACMERGSTLPGITTGLHDLDALTGGQHASELSIVAGRPGTGKTSLALGMMTAMVRATRRPGLFFSCEMPRRELANRMLCADARVDSTRLRQGTFTQDDMTAISSAGARIFQLPLWIDDSTASLARVRSKARKTKRERGLCAIAIDYLQIMATVKAERRDLELAAITGGLKSLAKELDVPIILLSQLNRALDGRGKDARPRLSDLRESGAIEQDADEVIFVYRDELVNPHTEDRGIAELIVAKQRNGPTDTIRTRFIRELTLFENLASPDVNYQESDVEP